MILRQVESDLFVEVDLIKGMTIDEMLQSSNALIYTTDIDLSASGYYSKIEDKYIPNEAKEIAELKVTKLAEVINNFEYSLQFGTMVSSLGFTVDNRRYADKNDKDNVQGLIDLGISSAQFKDFDGGFHVVDSADLVTLKLEMTQDGLSKYQIKWNLENAINSCTTLDELESINTQ